MSLKALFFRLVLVAVSSRLQPPHVVHSFVFFHTPPSFHSSTSWKNQAPLKPRHYGVQPRSTTLHVSRSPSSSASSSSNHQQQQQDEEVAVVYQKIVATPPKVPSVLFLGQLTDYLQDYLELPSDLPIPYEKVEDDNDNICTCWDSPLSSNPDGTRLYVEVVGIYTNDDEKEKSNVPSMAMVVVKKTKDDGKATPIMMKNLVEDSQRKIMHALDSGLDRFCAGKIKIKTKPEEQQQQPASSVDNFDTVDEAIQAELLEEHDLQKHKKSSSVSPEDVLIDTTAVPTTSSSEQSSKKLTEKKKEIKKEKKKETKKHESTVEEDFAVQAAKRQAIAQHKKKNKNDPIAEATNSVLESTEKSTGDFAVEAAKRIAAKQKKKTVVKKADRQDGFKKEKASTTPPGRNAGAKKKGFYLSISTPKEWAEKKKMLGPAKETSTATKKKTKQRAKVTASSVEAPVKPKATDQSTKVKTKKSTAKPKAAGQSSKVKTKESSVTATVAADNTLDKPPAVVNKKSNASNTKEKTIMDAQVVEKSTRTTQQPKMNTKRKVNLRVFDNPNAEDDLTGSEQRPFEKLIDGDSNKVANQDTLGSTTKRKGKKEETTAKPPITNKKKYIKTNEEKPVSKTSTDKKQEKTVSKEQMERDVMEAAQKVMTEITPEQGDMSPEELLQDVLKFGKDQDKQERTGEGFVSGAFEKAKELLQERLAQREERLKQEPGANFKEVNQENATPIQPNIIDRRETKENDPDTKSGMTAEEELKRIFEVGERMAEGRITMNTMPETEGTGQAGTQETAISPMGTTEKDIDDLIAADKEISSHARKLDDDLAELEVRINKSPGEELDGPKKNPIFDIFTGPEVYNPNVDPETAVNWPGALPGTKDVRLPKQLDEAVRQAKFAAEVLLTMRKEGGDENNPDKETEDTRYFVGEKELTREQVSNLRRSVDEAVQVGLIQDPLVLLTERSRLQMVLDELSGQPEERYQDIISNYKDLLLSDNFVALVRDRLTTMADKDLDALRNDDTSLEEPHAKERELLGHLVNYAQVLLKEARALGAELESAQLEIVRSICEVAMDPAHKTEEETSMALSDAVRDMRPMLDDMFVAYLKFAIAEEEGRLARAGVLDDPQHNEWLFVLKIVQQGVYAEISRGISRYIDHIGYVLRMETQEDRRDLLKEFIDVMPTMDVRPFVQVVDNIAGALGDSVRGDFTDATVLGEMSNKILQLHKDTHEMLPPERIKLMSRDADEWAAKQRQRLMKQRKIAQQRLKAAQETLSYDEEIRRRGEVERFD